MGRPLYNNNAVSTLASGITNVATTLTLATGEGAKFPNPSGGDWFPLTLTQASAETSWEIVYVTARSGDTCTVVRGQDDTTGAAWSSGDKAENRLTKNTIDILLTNTLPPLSGEVLVDFGPAPGSNVATVTVTGLTTLQANSKCDAWLMGVDTADHNTLEHLIVPMTVRAGNLVAGDKFDIVALAEMRLTGTFAVQWTHTQ